MADTSRYCYEREELLNYIKFQRERQRSQRLEGYQCVQRFEPRLFRQLEQGGLLHHQHSDIFYIQAFDGRDSPTSNTTPEAPNVGS